MEDEFSEENRPAKRARRAVEKAESLASASNVGQVDSQAVESALSLLLSNPSDNNIVFLAAATNEATRRRLCQLNKRFAALCRGVMLYQFLVSRDYPGWTERVRARDLVGGSRETETHDGSWARLYRLLVQTGPFLLEAIHARYRTETDQALREELSRQYDEDLRAGKHVVILQRDRQLHDAGFPWPPLPIARWGLKTIDDLGFDRPYSAQKESWGMPHREFDDSELEHIREEILACASPSYPLAAAFRAIVMRDRSMQREVTKTYGQLTVADRELRDNHELGFTPRLLVSSENFVSMAIMFNKNGPLRPSSDLWYNPSLSQAGREARLVEKKEHLVASSLIHPPNQIEFLLTELCMFDFSYSALMMRMLEWEQPMIVAGSLLFLARFDLERVRLNRQFFEIPAGRPLSAVVIYRRALFWAHLFIGESAFKAAISPTFRKAYESLLKEYEDVPLIISRDSNPSKVP